MTKHHAAERACASILARAARNAGTRQQVRAAARRFVRRHRRDAGYLAWVLRSVGASSALAVALLGLGATAAELPTYAALTGAANPMSGSNVGGFSRLALADLDGDGDLDLVAGEADPVLNYFENTGSAVDPSFLERTGAANPFGGAALEVRSAPAFGDLDRDGDLDALIGDYHGLFRYFENTGDATDPVFVARTGAANPMSGQDVGGVSTPALGDLDADGDLDLVVGAASGNFFWYENTGSATTPGFVLRPSHPLSSADVGNHSTPALGDIDGDGALDLVSGSSDGPGFVTFENTGSARIAAFAARTGAANPLDGQVAGNHAAPALGDLDSDGDLDLLAGEISGAFHEFENRTAEFAARTGAADPFDAIDTDDPAGSALVDLDGDGDRDLILGTLVGGDFRYARNTGSVSAPAFSDGVANPLAGFDVGQAAMPAAGDLDGDGDFDVLAGSWLGTFSYFRNTGSPESPAFVEITDAENPLEGADVGTYSAPAFGDFDGDGDLDLVSGRYGPGPALSYYENTGSPIAPAFVERTGAANPVGAFSFAGSPYSLPAVGDVDADGDLDLVVEGTFYLDNTGNATAPAFALRHALRNPLPSLALFPTLGDVNGDGALDLVGSDYTSTDFFYFEQVHRVLASVQEVTGPVNPLNGFDIGGFATTALGDLDGDGDLDLLAGGGDGAFFYFQNTGTAVGPRYAARTGAANPMNGQNAGGARSKPALGDLDGDGDLDVVAGWTAGFYYYENIGSATTPAFVDRTGNANPLDGEGGPGGFWSPVLADLDRDGDLDVLAGDIDGQFAYYENTGSATDPEFVERTDAANPLLDRDVGYGYASPALGDLDGDGDLDLVSGHGYGGFSYFRNVGTASQPAFAVVTDADNPLAEFDVSSKSTPSLGDLDRDGDLDLVTGRQQGSFAVHFFPEPARALLFGAGAALLALLDRWRRRDR